MYFNDKIALSALKYITGETAHVCRLCFASTDTKEVSLEDTVQAKTSFHNETIAFTNIFRSLGVPAEPQLPQVLCIKCANSTINSYLFQKLCQVSNDNWMNILNRLSKTLLQSDTISSNVQSVYLMINKEENLLLTGRKGYRTKNKMTVLTKIKDIIKSRRNYLKVKQTVVDTICEECGERYTSSLDLSKHLKIHTKLKHPCLLCPKIFSTSLQLEEHAERIHQPKKLQCPKCPKKFSTEKMLKIHNRIFHVATVCKLCNQRFPSRQEMRVHLDNHHTYNCPNCHRTFNNKLNSKYHIKYCGKETTKVKKEFFTCDICGKNYKHKNGVRSHLKIDHGFGKALSCDWCGKKFDAVSKLRNHIVKHTKEKNFHCGQCGGRFVTRAALVYHVRLHTGERPFPCDMCEESFLSASRRSEHKRRKHLERTQQCHVCHAKFVTSLQLQKHIQRHNNPYSKLYVSDDTISYTKVPYKRTLDESNNRVIL